MKFFKRLLLVSLFLILFAPGMVVLAANDGEKIYVDEDGNKVAEYTHLGNVPYELPDCDVVKFPAYFQSKRGEVIREFISYEYQVAITVSTPDIKELDNSELETIYDSLGKAHYNDFIMVTIEPLNTMMEFDLIAKSYIFIVDAATVVNPAIGQTITIEFSDYSTPSISISERVMDISMCAREGVNDSRGDGMWFKSDGAGMSNFDYWGWSYGGKDDIIFSATEVYLPYGMVSDVHEYFDDYYQYLYDKKELKKWFDSYKKYWNDKNYQDFDLDAYAKSVGASVSTQVIDDPFYTESHIDQTRIYRLNGHKISVNCGTDAGLFDGYSEIFTDVRVDSRKIYTPTNHDYSVRESDLPAIAIGDGYYISTRNLIILLELFESYK